MGREEGISLEISRSLGKVGSCVEKMLMHVRTRNFRGSPD